MYFKIIKIPMSGAGTSMTQLSVVVDNVIFLSSVQRNTVSVHDLLLLAHTGGADACDIQCHTNMARVHCIYTGFNTCQCNATYLNSTVYCAEYFIFCWHICLLWHFSDELMKYLLIYFMYVQVKYLKDYNTSYFATTVCSELS